MNDHESMFDDRSRWGCGDALLDEMPPQDFEVDYGDAAEFSFTSFLISAGIIAVVVFIMFTFL